MSLYWKIILIAFYLQPQTLTADNMNTALDKMIRYSMAANVQPCDDFFSYACGNYKENVFFFGSIWSKDLLYNANERYFARITELLDKYVLQKQEMAAGCRLLTENVKNYFDTCRKVTRRDLAKYLEEIKPGPDLNWPILDKENSEVHKWPHGKDFDVFSLMGKLRSLGIANGVFKFNSTRKFGKRTIAIFPHYKPRSLPNVGEIYAMLTRMRVRYISQIIEDASQTGKMLVKLLDDTKEIRHLSLMMKYSDLLARYPNLHFASYFREGLEEELPLNISITLYNPPFFQELNDKIYLFDKRKLCTYLMLSYLKPFNSLPTEPVYTDCRVELQKMFNLAINFLYYHHNSDLIETRIKPDVQEIFQNIVDMLRVQLQSHHLKLTIYEIESLRRKMETIRLNIGNLPQNASCDSIAQLYSSIPPLDESNYYKNHLLMKRFMKSKQHYIYFEASHDFKQNLPAVTYSWAQHLITLNYAYLIPPAYNYDYTDLGKYSLLGFVLAQQLIIANELDKYLSSAFSACGPVEPDVYIGLYTEKHRIIDTLSSEVIRKLVTLHYFNLQPIESLDYWKKHFFLYMAQNFCNTDSMIFIVDEVPKFRLSRIVMNIEGFSETFSCPVDSPMNPSKKCKI